MRAWSERAVAVAGVARRPAPDAASTAVLAVADAFTGHVPDAEAHASEAAAQVDALSDEELGHRLDALANLCTAELYLHRYPEAAAHARRGLGDRPGHRTGKHRADPRPRAGQRPAHVGADGRVRPTLLDEAIDAARLSGNVEALGWNLLGRSFTALAAGDVALALATAQEAVDLTRGLDDSLVSTNAGVALAHAHYESGEPRPAGGDPPDGRGRGRAPADPGRLEGQLLRAAHPLLAGRRSDRAGRAGGGPRRVHRSHG